MREIIFRGKRIDNGKWVYGFYTYHCVDHLYIARIERTTFSEYGEPVEYITVDNKTVGQFTGLLDKNGKKIFEGDVVKFLKYDYEEATEYWTEGAIEWCQENTCWYIHDRYYCTMHAPYNYELEIVGSIYEEQGNDNTP